MARIINGPWGRTRVLDATEFQIPINRDAAILYSMSALCSASFITMLVAFALNAFNVARVFGWSAGAFFVLMAITLFVMILLQKPE